MNECTCDYRYFDCLDCKVCTNCCNEYYMVTDKVWRKANPKGRGMLCIGCLELRLGRLLTSHDFIDAPVNTDLFDQSTRLQMRLLTK